MTENIRPVSAHRFERFDLLVRFVEHLASIDNGAAPGSCGGFEPLIADFEEQQSRDRDFSASWIKSQLARGRDPNDERDVGPRETPTVTFARYMAARLGIDAPPIGEYVKYRAEP